MSPLAGWGRGSRPRGHKCASIRRIYLEAEEEVHMVPVAAGEYVVRLKVGEEVHEQKIEIRGP